MCSAVSKSKGGAFRRPWQGHTAAVTPDFDALVAEKRGVLPLRVWNLRDFLQAQFLSLVQISLTRQGKH